MFTGIVEEVGILRSLRVGDKSAVLEIAATMATGGCAVGDSILTDGVCLTVTKVRPGGFTADVMPETVRRSTLADRRPGDRVNLERAMTLQSRLGGHLVSGHSDGVGLTIVAVDGDHLRVSLIPHTAAETTLSRLARGVRVNLEADLIAKYVYAFVAGRKPGEGLTWEKLADAGF